jgi:GGDEF domain-containing protein
MMHDLRSGLLNAAYFEVAVPERVAIARRALRPLSIVLVRAPLGLRSARERATLVQACLRDADTACQLSADHLGLILDDTPEDGAVWLTERLRRDLDADQPGLGLWAGIATYPAHRLSAEDLLDSAWGALSAARAWPTSRIEVAATR